MHQPPSPSLSPNSLLQIDVTTDAKKFQRHLTDGGQILGRKGQLHDAGLCFTLHFASRTLDLLAFRKSDFDLWVPRFRAVIEANRNTDPTSFVVLC